MNVDSSALFSKRKETRPFWYKYSFLSKNSSDEKVKFDDIDEEKSDTEIEQDIDGICSDDDLINDDSSYKQVTENSGDSNDTVLLDKLSYQITQHGLSTENTSEFFCKINRMHRKLKSEHHDAIKKLMTCDLSEIVDDRALSQELANCHEDGNWHKQIRKGQQISVRTGPFVVSNAARKKELQST